MGVSCRDHARRTITPLVFHVERRQEWPAARASADSCRSSVQYPGNAGREEAIDSTCALFSCVALARPSAMVEDLEFVDNTEGVEMAPSVHFQEHEIDLIEKEDDVRSRSLR